MSCRISCLWLASCPAGSSSASKFGLIVFVIALVIVVCIIFSIHGRIEAVRTHHLEKRLKWIHQHNQSQENPLVHDEDEVSANQTGDVDSEESAAKPSSSSSSSSSAATATTLPDTAENKPLPGQGDDVRIDVGKSNAAQRPGLTRRTTKRVDQTFDIEFERLSLTLANGTSILQNVSGALRSGRTCAIMGPSGSGKTTLINLLTSKVTKDEGRILINGADEDLQYYRKLIGFVPQEDIMMRELTVHDVLLHSAYMRLPSSMSRSKMTEKVLEIIDFLGLNSVMNSIVGDAERRGISGGQRKRVNIGMELVADPSLLFLDEPTSGLDSATSSDVCRLLRSVAHRKGLTVAAVIHSPSPLAFDQFDDLLLLGHGGRVVYHGKRTEAEKYFAAIGFPVPKGASPSDFYMDVISNNVKSMISKKFKPFYLARYWESYVKRAQTFYADGEHNGVEYRHPSPHASAGPSSPLLNPRVSALMQYPNLNQSAMSVQQGNHGGEMLAMTSINNISTLALTESHAPSITSSPLVEGSPALVNNLSSSLHPSSALQNKRSHTHNKSVSMSPALPSARSSAHLVPPTPISAANSPRTSMTASDLASIYSSPPPAEKLGWWETLQKSLRISAIETRMWWKGVYLETAETVEGIFLQRKDPIRNTANPFMMFWLCVNRARLQIYRNQRQFLYDQLLHLGCGMFISIAASRFDYLGRQPDDICFMTPYQLKYACAMPTDHLTEVGVFIALGVCFAGISVGASTFGNEKIVYWREKSSGLLTLPYYLAKVIADIPRIVLAGVMFSISLVVFFNQRSNYFYLLFIIIMLYAVAFAMGYLLSALVPQNRVALVGTGFTLAWAIVFSGDAPDLHDVMTQDTYSWSRWIWMISAPRYAIEAIYLREVQARPWKEITEGELSHTYKLGQFWWCFQIMAYIMLGWHVLAFLSLKLKDRNKQK
ncbi:hypothetical protein DFQ27_000036 [Actinomortierella ambigua]|uniref:ABC transporter domain-containing protein n=1 Tax=Actinomortierella ambigua TaxID=1343610 RepID=A0A9P6QJR0_9FUNG|nr:hypothetical protein DFQ27_000036 [Actinomortierella ambigua]